MIGCKFKIISMGKVFMFFINENKFNYEIKIYLDATQ